ncbi:endonuclease/exonuclease/phosphatase family protein [Phytomonospora endophytica]|uniref:Endonuclease/exonuclease/phosphatase family metal-dependent hydrolase n=1 Tax=Phytomonospora endophytica TaxID=714109 RepID=A0A841FRV6_9ACTN|nr:endonuclease/exonuclease/phosphatase family protein [Phytomonospora endophytica]MBB6036282.1 endonuclease/exonuclease/phosphatase family metal-dependent hydrolase [Phytomonospora endophytica]GIG67189.1 metal-dependent hydrolase [Phytomonospora endophytica]
MSNTISRRTLIGGGLGLAVGAFAFAAPAAASPYATIRVATFNIHHGAGGDGLVDLERVAAFIEDLDVDLVGLQEVDNHWGERSAWADQAAILSRLLGMRAVYGANLDLDPPAEGQPRRQYGTAILSRGPILRWSNTLLPKLPAGEQRGLLQATVEARGARLTFANTHLQHTSAAERQAQADAIVALLGERRTMLVGDLNATAEQPEIQTLTDVFADSWAAVGEGPGYTYDAANPHARIDFVLATPDVKPVEARVVTEAASASDHLPVVVEYRVRKGTH